MMIKFEILSETELLSSIRVGNPGLQLRRNKWRRTGLFLLNGLDRGKKRVYEVSEFIETVVVYKEQMSSVSRKFSSNLVSRKKRGNAVGSWESTCM